MELLIFQLAAALYLLKFSLPFTSGYILKVPDSLLLHPSR